MTDEHTTTSRQLQQIRQARQAQQRARQLWDAALGGRSGLPAPPRPGRTVGGVQQPSIGTVNDRGEVAVFHHPGVVTLSAVDPRPVLYGGVPHIVIHARVAPASTLTLTLYKNGVAVGSPFAMSGNDWVEDIAEQYDPGDTIHVAATNLGAGSTAGLVTVVELRETLDD